MSTKPDAEEISWSAGEIDQVIACINETQNAIDHFKRLFETRNGTKDYFEAKELALVAAMVRRWADWQPAGNIDLKKLADKINAEGGGGSGDGGKNVPDSPR
jgi:uncharacterized protein (DUF927 family)